jgi:hypothetical protein
MFLEHLQWWCSVPCTVQLDEESRTYAGLTQETGFWRLSIIAYVAVWLVKGAAALCTPAREECNKSDLTAAQCL